MYLPSCRSSFSWITTRCSGVIMWSDNSDSPQSKHDSNQRAKGSTEKISEVVHSLRAAHPRCSARTEQVQAYISADRRSAELNLYQNTTTNQLIEVRINVAVWTRLIRWPSCLFLFCFDRSKNARVCGGTACAEHRCCFEAPPEVVNGLSVPEHHVVANFRLGIRYLHDVLSRVSSMTEQKWTTQGHNCAFVVEKHCGSWMFKFASTGSVQGWACSQCFPGDGWLRFALQFGVQRIVRSLGQLCQRRTFAGMLSMESNPVLRQKWDIANVCLLLPI